MTVVAFADGYGVRVAVIVTQSTEGPTASTGALYDIHSGSIGQMVDNHKDIATEPVGPLFLNYNPVLASLFGVYA